MMGVKLGFQGVGEILNFHPIFVHFPIALLLVAIGFYFLGIVLKSESFLIVGKWNLFAGTLAAALAVWTGLDAAKTVSHGSGTHAVMMLHQNLGYAIVALSLLLSLWILMSKTNSPSKMKGLFIAGLLALGFMVAQTADLGGRMVFLNGVGVGHKDLSHQKIEADDSHHDSSHEH